jgi:hypothetical protein
MRMRKSVRRRWVEALRSGEYQQTTGVLAEVDGNRVVGNCCLGVLCELARADGVTLDLSVRIEERNADDHFVQVDARTYNGAATMPPMAVCEWAGTAEPRYEDWKVTVSADVDDLYSEAHPFLADRNDRGYTFEQIADLIENDLDAVDDLDDEEVQV